MKSLKKMIWSQEKFIVEGRKLWFVPYSAGILCQYDLDSRNMSLVKVIDDDIDSIDRYVGIDKVGENIILTPSYSDDISIYNCNRDLFCKYHLPKSTAGKFFSTCILDDSVYMFPFSLHTIIRIQFGCDGPEYEEIPTEVNEFISCLQNGNSIFLVRQTGELYRYDYRNNNFSLIKKIDAVFKEIVNISDDEFLILDSKGAFYKYSVSMNDLSKLCECKTVYHGITIRKGFVYAFPEQSGDYIDKYNLEDPYSPEQIEINVGEPDVSWKYHAFSRAFTFDSEIYVMNVKNQCLVEIDEKDSIREYNIEFPELEEKDKIELLRAGIKRGSVLENRVTGMDLKHFISAI